VVLIAETTAAVAASGGLRVQSDYSIHDAPPLDVLVVQPPPGVTASSVAYRAPPHPARPARRYSTISKPPRSRMSADELPIITSIVPGSTTHVIRRS